MKSKQPAIVWVLFAVGLAFGFAALVISVPLDGTRVAASGVMTKEERNQFYVQQYQQALSRPRAPKNPGYRPAPVVEAIPTGIIRDYSNAPIGISAFVPTSSWQDFVGSRFVMIWAGSETSDASSGMLVIQTADALDRVSHSEWHSVTHRGGALTIDSASGAVVSLHDANGDGLRFDAAAEVFI